MDKREIRFLWNRNRGQALIGLCCIDGVAIPLPRVGSLYSTQIFFGRRNQGSTDINDACPMNANANRHVAFRSHRMSRTGRSNAVGKSPQATMLLRRTLRAAGDRRWSPHACGELGFECLSARAIALAPRRSKRKCCTIPIVGEVLWVMRRTRLCAHER
jgi:hypothetical protein